MSLEQNVSSNDPQEYLELMSPKVDFVFKLLFGDENHKELLIAFLQSVLRLPKEELTDVELLNTELSKYHTQEKNCIISFICGKTRVVTSLAMYWKSIF